MAQDIAVNRSASVSSGTAGARPRANSAAYNLVPPLQQQQQQQQQQQHHQLVPKNNNPPYRPLTRARSKSAGSAYLLELDFSDGAFVHGQNHHRRKDGLAELIDFLKNQEPPARNFMSIPDGPDTDERGRWSKVKSLGRSKSLCKPPQRIQLPDSAISGTTTGGHRHIAISIPLAASPFGPHTRSQYPIFQNPSLIGSAPRYAPTRAVLNDKGVVTVMRTVTEDHESSSPTSNQSPVSPVYQRARGDSLDNQPPYSPEGSVRNARSNVVSEYFGMTSSPPRNDQLRRVSDALQGRVRTNSRNKSRPISGSSGKINRDGMPARRSSLTANRYSMSHGPTSIDAMMSQNRAMAEWPVLPSHSRTISKDESTARNSLSRSIITTSEHDPIVADATTAKTSSALGESPMLISRRFGSGSSTLARPRTGKQSTDFVEMMERENPKRSGSPASAKSSVSRREKVRDKKRRDLEAQRAASQMPSLPKDHVVTRQQNLAGGARPRNLRLDTTSGDEAPPVPDKSPARYSFGPIMVVANMRPSPAAGNSPVETQHKDKEPLKPSPLKSERKAEAAPAPNVTSISKAPLNLKPVIPAPVVQLSAPSNPTPPHSTHGSPAHKQHPYNDRTSLSRRREWKATRGQERKTRDAVPGKMPPSRARAKARQHLMPMEEVEESGSSATGKDSGRRHEVQREYRIREMERRVRRLERNGDVWLRALVPVLDNLNRTLAATYEAPRQRAQGWISDDEYAGPASVSPRVRSSVGLRPSSRGRMLTRSGISEREFLEQLLRAKAELEAEGYESDDMSGLDTIEPLMRELAGRSRLSFEARSMGVLDDEEAYLQQAY